MVYYINHYEVTSFPRHFPSLRYVAVRGSYRPTLVRDMGVLARYGLLDDQPANGGRDGVSIRRVVRDHIWETCGGVDDFDSHHLFLQSRPVGPPAAGSGGRLRAPPIRSSGARLPSHA